MGGSTNGAEVTPIVNATAVSHYGADEELNPEAAVISNDNNQASEESEVVVPLINVVVDSDDGAAAAAAPKWRDLPFAVLFWIHLAVMIYLGIVIAPKGFAKIHIDLRGIEEEMRKSDDITEENISQLEQFLNEVAAYMEVYPLRIARFLVLPCCLLAFVYGLFGTATLLKPCPRTMIYACLMSSFAWTALILLGSAIASGSPFLYVVSGVSMVAVVYYVRLAWRMVPFAAINLKLALEAIGRNWGILIVALLMAEIGFFWVIYWAYVSVGTLVFHDNECKVAHPDLNFDMDAEDYSDECDPPGFAIMLFLLSLYWTGTIIMNTMQVSVAGVMATWCLDKPNADTCYSPAISGSIIRAMTFSFGSICLGSLLQALMAAFRCLIDSARSRREREGDSGTCGTILFCVLDCIAELLDDLLRAFNQWAYIFVGLYGFSYIESGKRVMELFQARGFTAIITDNLVEYVLAFSSFVVGVATAATAWGLEHFVSQLLVHPPQALDDDPLGPPPPPPPPDGGPLGHPPLIGDGPLGPMPPAGPLEAPLSPPPPGSFIFGPLPHPGVWAAVMGFFIGLWVASVMMNVIKGAVNTLIVCWADSPAVMEAQHPVLVPELASTWRRVFDSETSNTAAPTTAASSIV